jgi:hypothetical protein
MSTTTIQYVYLLPHLRTFRQDHFNGLLCSFLHGSIPRYDPNFPEALYKLSFILAAVRGPSTAPPGHYPSSALFEHAHHKLLIFQLHLEWTEAQFLQCLLCPSRPHPECHQRRFLTAPLNFEISAPLSTVRTARDAPTHSHSPRTLPNSRQVNGTSVCPTISVSTTLPTHYLLLPGLLSQHLLLSAPSPLPI